MTGKLDYFKRGGEALVKECNSNSLGNISKGIDRIKYSLENRYYLIINFKYKLNDQ